MTFPIELFATLTLDKWKKHLAGFSIQERIRYFADHFETIALDQRDEVFKESKFNAINQCKVRVLQGELPPTLLEIAWHLQNDSATFSEHSKRGYLRILIRFEQWRFENRRKGAKAFVRSAVDEFIRTLPDNLVYRKHSLNAIRWWARKLIDLSTDHPELFSDKEKRDQLMIQMGSIVRMPSPKGTQEVSQEAYGRLITQDEFERLMNVCKADDSPAGKRDQAIFALAWTLGPRPAEIVTLSTKKVAEFQDPEGGVGYKITLHGKGSKERTLAVTGGTAIYLQAWLAARGYAGDENTPFFCAINKGGHLDPDRFITTQALSQIKNKRLEQAGIKGEQDFFGMHDFRRTMITTLLANNVDITLVAKIAGHNNITQTARYDRRGDEAAMQALRSRSVTFTPLMTAEVDAEEPTDLLRLRSVVYLANQLVNV